MTDLSQYSDSDLKSMYLQSLPDADLHNLHQQATPSSWEDAKKSFAGGLERGAAGTVMILPDLINQAVAGPQMLYRGLTGREHDNSPMFQPFYSSSDVLNMLPKELQPHDPQTPAGVVAGMVGGLAGGVTAYGAMKGASDIIAPFTQGGRNSMANNIIAKQASDPKQAANALQNVPQYVPGSNPTGGTASGDLGLIGTEKTLMQNPANFFGERLGAQNTARTNFINQVAGDETAVPRYTEMRSNETAPLYTKAMEQPIDPAAIKPVIQSIDSKIADVGAGSDAGKILAELKNQIKGALPNMEPVDTGLLDAQGLPITKPQFNNVTSGPLTQIFKENRDQLQSGSMQPGALGATVKGVIKPVNQQLGAALEAQNPKLAEANDLFSRMSRPIDETNNMQTLVPKMTGGIEDLNGQNIFSPAKVGNIMKQGEMQTGYDGMQPLNKALSPEQYQALEALNSDLQRSNAVNIPMIRPPGSNTFNNTASTAELTNSLAGKLAQHIPFFGKTYSNQNAKILQAIADKMLDPKMTREALLKGKAGYDPAVIAALMKASANGGFPGEHQ